MLPGLSYLFLQDSSLHLLITPQISHLCFQSLKSLIKKLITLLLVLESLWFHSRNDIVMHLVCIKGTRCPQVKSHMLAFLANEKLVLRYLTVLYQQYKACYSTQRRCLFSIFVDFEFRENDVVQKSVYKKLYFQWRKLIFEQ